jgi:hypothetical protein
VLLIVVTLGCSAPRHVSEREGSQDDRIHFDFDSAAAKSPTSQQTFRPEGTLHVAASVVSRGGGQVSSVDSRTGQGSAVRFPGFDDSLQAVSAALEIEEQGSGGPLSPARNDFAWGADFRVDPVSSSERSGSTDNGDNLVQRGLFGGTQYKLDVDGGHPACRVRGSTGSAGAVQVRLAAQVDSTHWYHVGCARSGSTLQLTVLQYGRAGDVIRRWSRKARSATSFGTVSWDDTRAPLTIGGKLTSDGQFVTPSSDQFNGVVDNVFYEVH